MSEACNAVFLEFSFCFAFYINAICKEAGPAFVLNNHMDKKKYKSITSQKERKGSLEAPTFLIPLLLGRSVCRPWSSPAWLPSGSSSTRPPVLAPDVSVNSGPEQQIPGAGSREKKNTLSPQCLNRSKPRRQVMALLPRSQLDFPGYHALCEIHTRAPDIRHCVSCGRLT